MPEFLKRYANREGLVEEETIYIRTDVGHSIGNPLKWFSRLHNATKEQRLAYEISPFGIHWEKLDEDLSLNGFFEYKRTSTTPR